MFSFASRQVMVVMEMANRTAYVFSQTTIGVEHVLAGILSDEAAGPEQLILNELGLNWRRLNEYFEVTYSPLINLDDPGNPSLPCHKQTRALIERALGYAHTTFERDQIEVSDLLLAMLQPGNKGEELLTRFGLKYQEVRERLRVLRNRK